MSDYMKTARRLYLNFTQMETFVPISEILLHPAQHCHPVIRDFHNTKTVLQNKRIEKNKFKLTEL